MCTLAYLNLFLRRVKKFKKQIHGDTFGFSNSQKNKNFEIANPPCFKMDKWQ